MDFVTASHRVDILTTNYHIQGEMRPRGNAYIFINDVQYKTLTIFDAVMRPIMHGARLGPMNVPELYLPKSEAQVITFENFTAAEAQILPVVLNMICFTDTFIIRGGFHTGPEMKPVDLFYSLASSFYPATEVEVFAQRQLSNDVSLKSDLAFVQREGIRAFYQS
jgi:hypothetical protein